MPAKKTGAGSAPKTSYEQLIDDETPWDMPMIARELDVQHQTVKKWRKGALQAEREKAPPHPNRLPTPDPRLSLPTKPVWTAGVIREWAMQTGRMTPEGAPQRSKPPGRPKGSGKKAAA